MVLSALLGIQLSACNSYITRTLTQSFSRIGEDIPDSPGKIVTPILPNVHLAISWIGHATVLIQIHDKIIVTDPLFTKSIGLLVKRFVMPGIDPAVLARVDCTIVSHMHFDHLSFGSLDELPKEGILVIADGMQEYTPEFGFAETVALKPWESIEHDGIKITAVPAQHFNGRYGIDILWTGERGYTGYVLEYEGITVYFAGDTGYNTEIFKEIGRRFKIDLALIPIAPGSGFGVGSRVHVNPRGAVKILEDLGAKMMVPIHFGTMYYGTSPNPAAQIAELREAARSEGVADRVLVLDVGEQRVIF